MNLLKLMRVKHYLKNLLILLPLIFSGQLLECEMIKTGIVIFFGFSFISSVVYIINDILDIEKDKLHPIKKTRPLASGKVSKFQSILIICFLITISITLFAFTNNLFLTGNIIIIIYLLMNILYSIKFKNIPLLDITVLAFGFVLRIIYGGLILNIEISNWLFLTVLSLSYYMALGKRRNEYQKVGIKSRKVLESYPREFLDKMMYLFMGLSIVFYSLWTTIGVVNDYFKYSVIFVIIILMKYSLNLENDSYGDPIDVIINDKILIALAGLYGLFCLFVLYGGVV